MARALAESGGGRCRTTRRQLDPGRRADDAAAHDQPRLGHRPSDERRDIVLHIETRRGLPEAVAAALEGLGYRLQPSIDPRSNTAHRFVRGDSSIDLVTSAGERPEQIDVLIADREDFAGSDRRRIGSLARALPRGHAAWRSLPTNRREPAQLALDILSGE